MHIHIQKYIHIIYPGLSVCMCYYKASMLVTEIDFWFKDTVALYISYNIFYLYLLSGFIIDKLIFSRT